MTETTNGTIENRPILFLKWGSVKGWGHFSAPLLDALTKWANIGGTNTGAMQHARTEAHKDALCELIDAVSQADGEIMNEWSGEYYDAAQAKTYIREHRT
jgi:hypothetical protein